ncbi:hypothetical protein [Nocardioides sp. URHA0020]|uniref:hypothetical protein n=1 Tax=Nocardioides sp. URHA0020 TaxID=1380392 RepID=UPI000685B453|nr:hypothetical protein [Nocardioides sp. URHA0020]
MRIGVRLAAACLLAAAAGVVGSAAPATAGTCSSADGVSVVVDFHELGGGARTTCVRGGGGDLAADLFPAAGFSLTRVQSQPGFVCRVSGRPSAEAEPCQRTPPADAYWGLWWSDGTSGSWTYASSGVDGLTIPDGGYVALSWSTGSRAVPGPAAAPHPKATATPRPTSKPSAKPSKKPTRKPPSTTSTTSTTAPGSVSQPTRTPDDEVGQMVPESATPTPTTTSTPSTSATPTTTPTASPTPSGSASSSIGPATAPVASSDPADPSDGGLPTWVGPVVVVLLFGAGAAVAVVRRRGSPAP